MGISFGRRRLRYGAMFAGALDTVFEGGRRCGLALEYVAAAEMEEARRECLKEAYGIAEAGLFETAEDMAKGFAAPLDVLSATPSCKGLSSAQREQGKIEELESIWAEFTRDVMSEKVIRKVASQAYYFFVNQAFCRILDVGEGSRAAPNGLSP